MPDDQDELIEQELIEQDELIEAARGAFRLFAEIATMAGNRPEESDVTEIADEIEDRKPGRVAQGLNGRESGQTL